MLDLTRITQVVGNYIIIFAVTKQQCHLASRWVRHCIVLVHFLASHVTVLYGVLHGRCLSIVSTFSLISLKATN